MNRLWRYLSTAALVGVFAATSVAQMFQVETFPHHVKIGEKHGFIDENCRLIAPPQFDDASYFSEGLAPVESGGK